MHTKNTVIINNDTKNNNKAATNTNVSIMPPTSINDKPTVDPNTYARTSYHTNNKGHTGNATSNTHATPTNYNKHMDIDGAIDTNIITTDTYHGTLTTNASANIHNTTNTSATNVGQTTVVDTSIGTDNHIRTCTTTNNDHVCRTSRE